MKTIVNKLSVPRKLVIATAFIFVGICPCTALSDDTFFTFEVDEVAAPTPAEPQPQAKAANAEKPKATRPVNVLDRHILFPVVFPNPLAFHMNFVAIKPRDALVAARQQRNEQRIAQMRVAAVRPRQADPAAQKAIQQQMCKMLEPMLKVEISFASRAAGLTPEERQKLIPASREWFDTFLVDFTKNQDPNQQQMFLQGIHGVWFGGPQQKHDDPRDLLRAGIAKLVAATAPKQKAAAYADECHKREEFARQVSVENLVERIDQKVKLSPDQWKKLTKTLNEHWHKSQNPQLEAFAMNTSMWPGAPDQWVLPELTPAQQAVLKRVNSVYGQVWFGGGMLAGMLGGEIGVIDDVEFEIAPPDADDADNPFAP